MLVHIQQHLDHAMRLEELARVAHFSPYHFHRVFRGMVGESVKEYTRRLRLERAAHQLKFSSQPVTQIAFSAGPYDRLGQTYARLCGEWLPASGREVRSSPAFEVYHNAPQFTEPEDLLTDIYMPLEPR